MADYAIAGDDIDGVMDYGDQAYDEMGLNEDGLEPDEAPVQHLGHSSGGHPRSVHQCNTCNKIFVSYKGLQQHAVIHTDQKPFVCDICKKAFRFKSNLFEHRSVHSGFTPHACPYCGKTCRLKGNLKKHLKTHVHSKEELENAWRPFASNRRPAADIPEDAIIVRGSGEPYFNPPSRTRKRKLGLGQDVSPWVDKIRRGDIMSSISLEEKLRRAADNVLTAAERRLSLSDLFETARVIPFETYACPMCRSSFLSRVECLEHIDLEHPNCRKDRPHFCEVCLATFFDRQAMEQHESYHKRVHLMMESGEIEINDPEILLPATCHIDEDD